MSGQEKMLMPRSQDERQASYRIRANCCPPSGLAPAELEKHIAGIQRIVLQAMRRRRQ